MFMFSHVPVLLEPVIAGLNIDPDAIYVDMTVGGGGHAAAIASRLKEGRLICFDQDPEAISAAGERLSEYTNITFVNKNFSEMADELDKPYLNIETIHGALMDLGVSSYQLDNKDRGFSFHEDAPLDMRMSGSGPSAADVVNEYPAAELEQILFRYGEEKYARGIVRGIVTAREKEEVKTTLQLAEIVKRNVPLSYRRDKHPCRKTFQAIRIEVNREFDALKAGLSAAFSRLDTGGRLAVITFHSLEDAIVKETFREYCTGCTCPPDFPICVCGKKPRGRLVNRKPIVASDTELSENPRARSAKLRVIEKI